MFKIKHILHVKWPKNLMTYKCHSTKYASLMFSLIPRRYLNGHTTHSTTSVKQDRLYPFNENAFAYNIISKDLLPKIDVPPTEVETLEEFETIMDKNWREATASEIVKAFKSVKKYCKNNSITVEDLRFDKLVDGLMDHCEKLTYVEVVELLECLSALPLPNGYDAHNFHDIWSCLDDICCWQMVEWTVEQSFTIANLWYRLNLGRLCDYIFLLLDRLTKKADKLNKHQLTNIMFYFNVCRKRSVDFEYEYALAKNINEMNINELAVVAMGYFKTKTKIKIPLIMERMISSVCASTKDIDDIPLSAIMKALRFSFPVKLTPEIFYMLDNLVPEIPRLSELSCLHIALLSTGIQNYHSEALQRISEKMVKSINNQDKIRLKDIERILNILTMFNYDPKTEPDIFQCCYNEIHSSQRVSEIIKYNRCLVSALHYLSYKNLYSYQLMDRVLNVEYITEVYGKSAKNIPRELFSLDCCIDIDCPDYSGNRLPKLLRHKAAKWVTEFTPTKDQLKKISAADQLILDTINVTGNVVGGNNFLLIDHILPHFPRADIVVCKDKNTGKFREPPGFKEYILGDVMFPVKDENLIFYCLVIVGWHNTIKDTNIPLGMMWMKKKQLEKIGYKPAFVIWKEFLGLSEEGRNSYISSKLLY
ncbi:unnamed protein product [Callosobruchus maculatus]|uniref:Uncharacterized protein n=1 Tax=Callosobruchus maculatus TaxID=64391 RepID=A0A653DQR8_CALMS|nr:unnamed protein product [Callosobruchus maculatus]